MENPVDSDAVVCAGDRVRVEYVSLGRSLRPGDVGGCSEAEPVVAFDVVGPDPDSLTLASCEPTAPCEVGELMTGDTLPDARLFFSDGSSYDVSVGRPPMALTPPVFGGLLPLDETIQVYTDIMRCAP